MKIVAYNHVNNVLHPYTALDNLSLYDNGFDGFMPNGAIQLYEPGLVILYLARMPDAQMHSIYMAIDGYFQKRLGQGIEAACMGTSDCANTHDVAEFFNWVDSHNPNTRKIALLSSYEIETRSDPLRGFNNAAISKQGLNNSLTSALGDDLQNFTPDEIQKVIGVLPPLCEYLYDQGDLTDQWRTNPKKPDFSAPKITF